jgi:hypothetical protein
MAVFTTNTQAPGCEYKRCPQTLGYRKSQIPVLKVVIFKPAVRDIKRRGKIHILVLYVLSDLTTRPSPEQSWMVMSCFVSSGFDVLDLLLHGERCRCHWHVAFLSLALSCNIVNV